MPNNVKVSNIGLVLFGDLDYKNVWFKTKYLNKNPLKYHHVHFQGAPAFASWFSQVALTDNFGRINQNTKEGVYFKKKKKHLLPKDKGKTFFTYVAI